jgi:phosphatidylglycerophosphate synthase
VSTDLGAGPRQPEGRQPGGYAATVRRLAGAQKPPAAGSPAYSRFVNRRVGRYLAAAAYQLGMTPNQVTAVSAGFSLAGIAAVAVLEPTWPVAVAVALALLLGYALDSADGQLARLRGGGSPGGEWLDHVVDSAKIVSLHSATLVSLYRFGGLDRAGWLLLPLGYLLVGSVAFFAMTLNDQLKRVYRPPGAPAPVIRPSTVRSLLVLPTDYGVLCIVFVLLAAPRAFLLGYGLLLAANAGYLLAAVVKWYRDIAALAAVGPDPDPSRPREADHQGGPGGPPGRRTTATG